MAMEVYFLALLFLQTVSSITTNKTSLVVRNHSIIFFSSTAREVPCVYCTDEYYSEKNGVYYEEVCYEKYIDHQNESKIYNADNSSLYHRICRPFKETAKYKQDVQCEDPQSFENGRAYLLNLYFTADNLPAANITEPIVGTQIKIECNPGHMTDNLISECAVINHKPTWSPPPSCRRIGCSGIPNPENGISNCDINIVENGTLCNVTCDPGYVLNREYTQCIDGEYTHQLTCEPIPKAPEDNGSSTKVIIGGTIGGIVAILVIIVIVLLCKRYKKHKKGKVYLVGDQGEPNECVAENGGSNVVESRRSNGVESGGNLQSNGIANGVHYKKGGETVDLTPTPASPPSSHIPPESSRSSLFTSMSTNTSGLPSLTPSNVHSPSDDERSPLMQGDQNFFTANDSQVQPVAEIIESRSEVIVPEVTGPEVKGPGGTGSEVTGPGGTGSEVTVPEVIGSEVTELSDGSSNTMEVKKKIPVENEDVDVEDQGASAQQPKQATENEDFSDPHTLGSTGSDLLNMAAGGDATTPKEMYENDQTSPKVLSDLPRTGADRSLPSLKSNPGLTDFGFNTKDSDVQRLKADKANKELPTNPVDGAYGSSETTLESNPTNLLEAEEGKCQGQGQGQGQEQDTGRGTMDDHGNMDINHSNSDQ